MNNPLPDVLLALSRVSLYVVQMDTEGTILFCNDFFLQKVGWRMEELAGRDWFDVFAGDEAHLRRNRFREMAKEKTLPGGVSSTIHTRTGERLSVNWSPTVITSADGTDATICSIGQDMTDLQDALLQIEQNEERFRAVIEQTEDGIAIVAAATGMTVFVNSALVRILGVDKGVLMQAGLPFLCERFGLGHLLPELERLREKREVIASSAIVSAGKEMHITSLFRFVGVYGNDLIYCSFRNMTEKVLLEREARLMQGRLIYLNKMSSLGLLLAGIGHEINNPNMVILTNSQLIAGGVRELLDRLPEESGENSRYRLLPRLAEDVTEASCRIRNIITDLKDFASGGKSDAHKPFDLNLAVTKAASILNFQIRNATTRFQMELAEDLPPVLGNIRQIEQVVINLILNALQALADRTRGVRLETGRGGNGGAFLRVSDEGCGMSPEVLASLKTPFFTTKGDKGGTGLGLFISHAIVDFYGGTLRYESEEMTGTTAIMEFPPGDVHGN